ncbi:ThiF family adenylyltransferase [Chitinophaga tropicalis]|nr:ThiF family adenylyltransferase [Chitinophaga tropicalis]
MRKVKIAGLHYDELKTHLFPGDNKEAVAVALCGRSQHEQNHTLTVMELLLIPYDKCEERTSDRVTWPTAMINALVGKAQKDNLAILKIHCHPGGGDFFSGYDDIADHDLFEHLFAWLQTDLPHASCIMLPDGRLFGRFFGPDLKPQPIQKITVAGADIQEWYYDHGMSLDEHMHRRNLQAFGKGTMERLSRMRIGVVGCSGTGSPVIEQLKRLGVGELVVVDPDYVDVHNLNRIIGTTRQDALSQVNKITVVEREVEKVGFGTHVIAFARDIVDRDVVKELSQCDVLFSCVDGVEARHVLNLISTFYLVPLLDLGVKLDADGMGSIDGIYASVHYIQPGGSSLLSRGQYTLEQLRAASIKRASPEEYHRNEYLAAVNEDTPAVISVNIIPAGYAVNELLARIHAYRFVASQDIDTIRIHFNLVKVLHERHPSPCAFFSKYLGWGDRDLLLNLLELGDDQNDD